MKWAPIARYFGATHSHDARPKKRTASNIRGATTSNIAQRLLLLVRQHRRVLRLELFAMNAHDVGDSQDGPFGEGDMLDDVRAIQGDVVKEAQSADGLIELAPRGLGVDQVQLILANLIGSENLWRLTKAPAELLDRKDVGLDGPRRQVAQSHVVDEALPKEGVMVRLHGVRDRATLHGTRKRVVSRSAYARISPAGRAPEVSSNSATVNQPPPPRSGLVQR